MEMAEQYSYWAPESAGSSLLPSPYTPSLEATEVPLHLLYGLDNPEVCQPVNPEAMFADQIISPLSLNKMHSDFRLHCATVFKQDSTAPNSVKSLSPEIDARSPTLSDGRGMTSDDSNSSPQEHGQKIVKRRIQNRAAQRRFRERRDEQNKNLQEKATELQEKYQALEERLRQKSEEANQLQSDNVGLKSEVENLRLRWRTMVLLLQRPNSLQFLSVLVGGEKSLTSPDGQDLDGYLRCLDALILPDRAQP